MISMPVILETFRKRTNVEKTLFLLLLLLSIALICLIVLTVLKPRKCATAPCQPVCRTSGCQKIGSRILESLDESVDPCEDFYHFACGGWEKRHEIPDDVNEYGVLEVLRNKVLSDVRDLFTAENFSEIYAVENAKIFYDSCMDTEAIERRNTTPILGLLHNFGGWPLLEEEWTESSYDPLSAIASIQLKTSFGFLVLVMIGSDPQNTTRNMLQLDVPSLTIRSETLLNQTSPANQKELAFYEDFFREIATLLGSKTKDLDEEFQGIVNIETFMSEIMTPKEERSTKVMDVNELKRRVPETDWLRFLQELTNSTLNTMGQSASVTGKESIMVKDFNYIKRISSYLENKDNARQIANYLGWRVVLNRLAHLPTAFGKALQEYSRKSGFAQTVPDRWVTCVKATNNAFADEVSFLYIRKHFPEEVRNEIMKLVLDIQFALRTSLQLSPWMDSPTRKAALSKLNAMKLNVGYPEWLADGEQLDSRYEEANKPAMTEDEFENDLALTLHATKVAIQKLRKPNIKEAWTTSPITVNAAYNRNRNAIMFPAAFLQIPMYSPFAPRFYNYAAIGSIIGHEITHGFDSEGRLRNSSGELQNWWSHESEAEFMRRARCFVDQYSTFGVDGERTLAENIADNGGLRLAYKEFSRWKDKQQEDALSLPGLQHFTIEQQFFLTYASIWCTKYRPKAWNYTMLYDVHTPSPYRLKGTLMNTPEFQEAFRCTGAKPQNICSIW